MKAVSATVRVRPAAPPEVLIITSRTWWGVDCRRVNDGSVGGELIAVQGASERQKSHMYTTIHRVVSNALAVTSMLAFTMPNAFAVRCTGWHPAFQKPEHPPLNCQ
eukprot:scaffold176432_cov14-Tisochrysis_lutea.AAC.1